MKNKFLDLIYTSAQFDARLFQVMSKDAPRLITENFENFLEKYGMEALEEAIEEIGSIEAASMQYLQAALYRPSKLRFDIDLLTGIYDTNVSVDTAWKYFEGDWKGAQEIYLSNVLGSVFGSSWFVEILDDEQGLHIGGNIERFVKPRKLHPLVEVLYQEFLDAKEECPDLRRFSVHGTQISLDLPGEDDVTWAASEDFLEPFLEEIELSKQEDFTEENFQKYVKDRGWTLVAEDPPPLLLDIVSIFD